MAILDFSVAFDKVSHTRLKQKLEYYAWNMRQFTWMAQVIS